MNQIFAEKKFQALLHDLRQQSVPDHVTAWPASQLQSFSDCGVMTWDVPREWGGIDLEAADQLEGLRLLSSACLVTTFVLTQRSAAVRRIATSANQAAKERYLPRLLSGEIFATVGISHLTTSGQHLRTPRVQVRKTDRGYVLNGIVPWATGATMAQVLVTGGTLPDGREILAALPGNSDGLIVKAPVEMMALNASQTGAVEVNDVEVTNDDLLHGPVEKVMSKGTGGGAGSLGTSALAIGATCGSLMRLADEAVQRPDLMEFVNPLQRECDVLLDDLRAAAAGIHPSGDSAVEQIRRKANSLVMRTAQTWLAATKGAGFVKGHPAERAVRESMFFLVWSCPQPVLAGNLRELACGSAPS